MQGDCTGSAPRESGDGELGNIDATPRGSCRLLSSDAVFVALPARLVGSAAVRPPQDVWLHGLHLVQLNETLADLDGVPALMMWAPATSARLWVTQVAFQTVGAALSTRGADGFIAGAHKREKIRCKHILGLCVCAAWSVYHRGSV